MRNPLYGIHRRLLEFEAWFGLRFGWFFTNGMKQGRGTRVAKPVAGAARAKV